jgi:hypothetical protein
MKFRVWMDLKNFPKALKKIAKGGEKYFPEALALIQKHRLYKQALSCYKDQPDLFKNV